MRSFFQFFDVLGVAPLIGRSLLADENQPGRSNVVVLSYRFWQEHFGSIVKSFGITSQSMAGIFRSLGSCRHPSGFLTPFKCGRRWPGPTPNVRFAENITTP